MREELERIRTQTLADIHSALDNLSLDAVRVRVLGKKGELTALLKQMGKLSPEERPVMGQLANSVRAALEDKGYTVESAQIEMVPQTYQKLEKQEDRDNMEKMLDLFEDDDDVQNVWHNWDNEE